MKPRVTLKDVARIAGVHHSTVSRALNPRTQHLLTPEVIEKVRQVSLGVGYRPNAAAHSLRTNRTKSVGIIVPDITNPVFPPIIRGIESSLARHGYLAFLADTDGRLDQEAEIADMLRARGVDGLILASVEREDAAISRLAADGMPIVTVNRRIDDLSISSVVNDEDEGIRQVLAHLVSLGHRSIANIAGPQTFSTGVDRYQAFERHRLRLGASMDHDLIVFASAFNEEEGERGVEEILRRGVACTAIVCSNDRVAIGAIAALRRHGLGCPGDVSVSGYNDMPLVDRLSPALTTVRIEHYNVGIDAATVLIEMIETSPHLRVPRHIVRPVELMVRASTSSHRLSVT